MSWRRRSRFDFAQTCPVIDGNLTKIADAIYRSIPDGDPANLTDFIMERISPFIEDVRSTNVHMRDCAEHSIGELHDEIDSLHETVKELEDKVSYLEQQLSEHE